MVWKDALPDRRFVHVQHTTMARRKLDKVSVPRPNDYLGSKLPIPGMLHACSESRRIAIEAGWKLEFGKEDENEVTIARILSFCNPRGSGNSENVSRL